MRECGGCNLCCALEYIKALDKPRHTMCEHCNVGVGCKIYDHPARPHECETFKCEWLVNAELPTEWRPDKIGAYAVDCGEYYKVMVAREPRPKSSLKQTLMVMQLQSQKHVILVQGMELIFHPGSNQPVPRQINVEWVL